MRTGNGVYLPVLLLLGALAGCEGRPPEADAPVDSIHPVPLPLDTVASASDAAPSLPTWTPLDTLPLLAANAAQGWRLRELTHAPEYFALVGWKDAGTLWGLAGCNPVELSVDVATHVAWDLEACGGMAPAPDGRSIAWGSGKGGDLWIGERDGAQRALRAAGAPAPVGEGEPSGEVLWSPDGSRVLMEWAAEWESFYALVDVATGSVQPIQSGEDGYYLTDAWNWLGNDRILFSAQAVRDQTGRSEYSESGGYRADLAVYDLPSATYTRVTSVGDSVMLRPLARWNGGEILVGERARGSNRLRKYWTYDPRDWSRRPAALPAATDVRVFGPTRVLLLDRVSEQAGAPLVRIFLWDGDGDTLPLLEVRGGDVAWSPDGRRIAATSTVEEVVQGAPGSYRTRYFAYVLEPR
jgi:hypothetical protein